MALMFSSNIQSHLIRILTFPKNLYNKYLNKLISFRGAAMCAEKAGRGFLTAV